MVSIGPAFSQHLSQTQWNGADPTSFSLPESTRKGLSGPDSNTHLALVGPSESGQNPGLFDMVRGLLAVGRAVAALFGYFVGIGSQLLRELLSNPTADTRQLVRIIRDLQAQGLDIDSAIALRELPNGDIGVYAIRDPDDPFPELLAIIKPDGTIVTQAPPSGASVPLEWNPGDRRVPEWDGPDIQRNGWQPGTVQIDQMQRNHMPEDFMQNSPSSSLPSGGFDWEGFPEFEFEFNFDPEDFPRPTFPGLPELPPTDSVREAQRAFRRRELERLKEAAREAIQRTFRNSPFVTGSDPIAEAIAQYGPMLEVFLHAMRPQYTPGVLGGAPSSRPGISTATINALRNLDPTAAADLVNEQLADTIENVPPNYRDAILEALRNGDEQDPDIERAITRLEQLREAEGPDVVDGPPVVTNIPDAIRLLQDRYGMYVADDLANVPSDRVYHYEETFLEMVNHAIPILDRINELFPGVLKGIGLALRTPNSRASLESGYITVGVSSETTGVISLMAPSQIAKFNILQDVTRLFLGTVAHEVMHALVAKAAPMLVQRFRANLEPVVTVHGPNNANPPPGSYSRREIIDEMYFPGATWAEFLAWAKHEGYIIQPTTEEILNDQQELGYVPSFTPRYEGDITIFRDPGEPACETLGECISRYAGRENEGLPELLAALILGLTEPHAPGEELPHDTIGLFPNLPPPPNLLEHLRNILHSAIVGETDSFYSPARISPESYADGE